MSETKATKAMVDDFRKTVAELAPASGSRDEVRKHEHLERARTYATMAARWALRGDSEMARLLSNLSYSHLEEVQKIMRSQENEKG